MDERKLRAELQKQIRGIAGAIPDTLTPFSQLKQGAVTRMGIGVAYAVPAGGIAAGGTVTISHGLNRLPNVCAVLDNPGAYKGDCFFVSRTTTSCVVQVSAALAQGAVILVK